LAQAHVTRRRQPRTLRAKRVAMPSNNQSQRRQKAGKSAAVAERKPAASAEAGPKQAAKQGTPSAQPPKKEKGKKKKAKKAKEPEPEPTPVEPSAYSVLVAKKLRNSTKRLNKLENIEQLECGGKKIDQDQRDSLNKKPEVASFVAEFKEIKAQFEGFDAAAQKDKDDANAQRASAGANLAKVFAVLCSIDVFQPATEGEIAASDAIKRFKSALLKDALTAGSSADSKAWEAAAAPFEAITGGSGDILAQVSIVAESPSFSAGEGGASDAEVEVESPDDESPDDDASSPAAETTAPGDVPSDVPVIADADAPVESRETAPPGVPAAVELAVNAAAPAELEPAVDDTAAGPDNTETATNGTGDEPAVVGEIIVAVPANVTPAPAAAPAIQTVPMPTQYATNLPEIEPAPIQAMMQPPPSTVEPTFIAEKEVDSANIKNADPPVMSGVSYGEVQPAVASMAVQPTFPTITFKGRSFMDVDTTPDATSAISMPSEAPSKERERAHLSALLQQSTTPAAPAEERPSGGHPNKGRGRGNNRNKRGRGSNNGRGRGGDGRRGRGGRGKKT